jgi:hypothetical protein
MQMKMFIHNDPEVVESQVNNWLGEFDLEVCHVTQSQCERQGRLLFVISVYYNQAIKKMSEVSICA